MNIMVIVWDGIQRRKIRSALSILGIAIAAAALFSMLSLRENYELGMRSELDFMGSQVVAVAKGCPYEAVAVIMSGSQVSATLPEEVVEQIRSLPNIKVVSPGLHGTYRYEDSSLPLLGVTSEELELKPGWIIEGRFPEQFGEAVLGSGMVDFYARRGEENDFWRWWSPCCFGLSPEWDVESPGKEMALGETLQVSVAGEPLTLTVVGILEKTGSKDDFSTFTTMETVQKLLHLEDRVAMVNIQVEDTGLIPETIENVQAIPDVQAVTSAQVMGTLQNLIETGQNMFFMVMLVALFVGGLGTMNIMLMSVFERTREIGMMKAVGASGSKIFQMFILEGVLICLAGGILGAAAGWVISLMGNFILDQFVSVVPSHWTAQVSWYILGVSIGFPLLVGVLAALYPAIRASSLDPMEALRSQ
ncbi:ABC transporter permease [Candidatus Contubernalis alkaliaceticus]|uniref:ABC transporter permease n=1 Tax=Candidatus Contubernalis alkaliaceticus TaxID=338645 RepID=UPI001F4C1EDC|nr:FtsX-like permease family protein [Candidatus Contubernalis alkalaceticus]UNC91385.1 ABC transporter permease [Candidatus Contubernalis alkalaceticus]